MLTAGADTNRLELAPQSAGLAAISLGMLALFLDLGHKPYVWRLYLTMKPWSPMSVGSWALLIFGVFSLLSFLGARFETADVGLGDGEIVRHREDQRDGE